MPLYKTKPIIFFAEQFDYKKKPYPLGVEEYTKKIANSDEECIGFRIKKTTNSLVDDWQVLYFRDYIITDGKGRKIVVRYDDFDLMYEPLNEHELEELQKFMGTIKSTKGEVE
jgi:hypothetical protein